MSDDEPPLRDQIDEALARIRRELEILESPSSIGGGSDDGNVIAALRSEYQALREARARLGPRET